MWHNAEIKLVCLRVREQWSVEQLVGRRGEWRRSSLRELKWVSQGLKKNILMCSEIANTYSTMTIFSLWHQHAPLPIHHVWMRELDHKEGWVLKNWCFWTVVFEKTLESPLDSKDIKPVNPKGNQPWIFIERIDAEAEVPNRPADVKSRLIGKKPWCWKRLQAKGEGGNRG